MTISKKLVDMFDDVVPDIDDDTFYEFLYESDCDPALLTNPAERRSYERWAAENGKKLPSVRLRT